MDEIWKTESLGEMDAFWKAITFRQVDEVKIPLLKHR